MANTDSTAPPALAVKIRELIKNGEFGPGDHLGTVELAQRFGVSRGPVREALRLLESLNLIRIVPQKGAFVIALEDREVGDLLGVREVLYALLAERCAQVATDAELQALGRALERLEAVNRSPDTTPHAFQRATYEFVGAMYRIGRNPRLAEMIKDLSEGAGFLYGHLSMATREMRQVELRGYQALTRAIQERNATKAFTLARSMHAKGVQRARELHNLLPGEADRAGRPLRGRRPRRAAARQPETTT
jgi:DNA-binding GntR family transcriptional regulator